MPESKRRIKLTVKDGDYTATAFGFAFKDGVCIADVDPDPYSVDMRNVKNFMSVIRGGTYEFIDESTDAESTDAESTDDGSTDDGNN